MSIPINPHPDFPARRQVVEYWPSGAVTVYGFRVSRRAKDPLRWFWTHGVLPAMLYLTVPPVVSIVLLYAGFVSISRFLSVVTVGLFLITYIAFLADNYYPWVGIIRRRLGWEEL